MKVRKSLQHTKPAYPSLRQFVKGKKWAGVAAIGLGTVTGLSGCRTRVVEDASWNRPTGGVIVVEPAQPVTYSVKKGDTLSSLALRLLGQRGRWREILAANPGVVPERLKIGQTLVIPAAKGDSGYTR